MQITSYGIFLIDPKEKRVSKNCKIVIFLFINKRKTHIWAAAADHVGHTDMFREGYHVGGKEPRF